MNRIPFSHIFHLIPWYDPVDTYGLLAQYKCPPVLTVKVADSSKYERHGIVQRVDEQDPWIIYLEEEEPRENYPTLALANSVRQRKVPSSFWKLCGPNREYIEISVKQKVGKTEDNRKDYSSIRTAKKRVNKLIRERVSCQKGIMIEFWLGFEKDALEKTQGIYSSYEEPQLVRIMSFVCKDMQHFDIELLINKEADIGCFFIKCNRRPYPLGSFPLNYLKTIQKQKYYFSHAIFTFNEETDEVALLLSGDSAEFTKMTKQNYAIYCSHSLQTREINFNFDDLNLLLIGTNELKRNVRIPRTRWFDKKRPIRLLISEIRVLGYVKLPIWIFGVSNQNAAADFTSNEGNTPTRQNPETSHEFLSSSQQFANLGTSRFSNHPLSDYMNSRTRGQCYNLSMFNYVNNTYNNRLLQTNLKYNHSSPVHKKIKGTFKRKFRNTSFGNKEEEQFARHKKSRRKANDRPKKKDSNDFGLSITQRPCDSSSINNLLRNTTTCSMDQQVKMRVPVLTNCFAAMEHVGSNHGYSSSFIPSEENERKQSNHQQLASNTPLSVTEPMFSIAAFRKSDYEEIFLLKEHVCQFIYPLTCDEISMICEFHTKGVQLNIEPLKEPYQSSEQYNNMHIPSSFGKIPISREHMEETLSILTCLFENNNNFCIQNKWSDSLRISIIIKDLLKSIVQTHGFLSKISNANGSKYELNFIMDGKLRRVEKIEKMFSCNSKNLLICNIMISIQNHLHQKYMQNSSLILIMQVIVCRIVENTYIQSYLLLVSALSFFARGCMVITKQICEFYLSQIPDAKKNIYILWLNTLSKDKKVRTRAAQLFYLCHLIQIDNYSLLRCILQFGPEWGWFLFKNSTRGNTEDPDIMNGFLGTLENIHSYYNEEVLNDALSGLKKLNRSSIGQPLEPPKDNTDANEPNTNSSEGMISRESLNIENQKVNESEVLYAMFNVPPTSQTFYLMTPHKETKIYINRVSFTESLAREAKSQLIKKLSENLQNALVKLKNGTPVCISSSPFDNIHLLGKCPYCKQPFTTFEKECTSCKKSIDICYETLVYCTDKYKCPVCSATYSKQSMDKSPGGFTCIYCGLFFWDK